MSTQRLVQLARRPIYQDVLPAVWLCPALLSSSRCFTSTASSHKADNLPGRLKAKMRRERVREGEKLRRAGKMLEHGRRPGSGEEVEQIVMERVSREMEYFRALIQNSDVVQAFEILARDLGPRALDVKLTETFLRAIHHKIRTRALSRQQGEEIVNGVRDWYTRRNLPGSPASTRILLACYRDLGKQEAAVAFWDWARRQRSSTRAEEFSAREMRQLPPTEVSPDYTDLSSYGMALPILARAGRSVEETEDIYIESVRRYATGFNEYHLSHTAWQPHPDQPTTIPGASVGILTGLMASRFTHGRTVPGYLSLDTILKLHPTQVPVSVVAELSKERPLTEQVQVLCMALKGGHRASSAYVATTLQDLGELLLAAQSFTEKVNIFEAILIVLRLAHLSRVSLNSQHLNMLLATTILSAKQAETDMVSQLKCIHNFFELIDIFKFLGAEVDQQTVRLIGKLTGRDGPRDVATQKLDALWVALTPLPAQLSEEHFWEYLEANASLGLFDPIQDVWQLYFTDTLSPSKADILRLAGLLAKSVVATDLLHTLKEGPSVMLPRPHYELIDATVAKAGFGTELESDFFGEVHEEIQSQLLRQQHHQTDQSRATMFAEMGKLLSHFKAHGLAEQSHDLHSEPVTRISVLPRPEVPDSWQRELYRELVLGQSETVEVSTDANTSTLTVESTVAEGSQQPPPKHGSPTGIPLADLRYQNWCDMNHVLLEAHAFDTLFNQKVDEVIAKGESVFNFKSVYNVKRSNRRAYLERQWDFYKRVREHVESSFENEETWRSTIKDLRKGLEPPPDV